MSSYEKLLEATLADLLRKLEFELKQVTLCLAGGHKNVPGALSRVLTLQSWAVQVREQYLARWTSKVN